MFHDCYNSIMLMEYRRQIQNSSYVFDLTNSMGKSCQQALNIWCTFGILLLFLALVPEASTCIEENIRNIFMNMINHDITRLESNIQKYAPECNQNKICNQNEAIEVIYNMSCQLERISSICNITAELKNDMDNVAKLTFTALKNCTMDQRIPKRHCQGTGGRKRLCPICRIKEAVSKSKFCWFRFVRRRPP